MLVLTVFSGIFGFFGLLFLGNLSNRVGRKRVYVGGCLLVIASAFPVFWLISTETFVFTLPGHLLATVGFCATCGPMGTLFSTGCSSGLRGAQRLFAALVWAMEQHRPLIPVVAPKPHFMGTFSQHGAKPEVVRFLLWLGGENFTVTENVASRKSS